MSLTICRESLCDTAASIIVNPVDVSGVMDNQLIQPFLSENPHIEKECLKYIRTMKKGKKSVFATAQFVPLDYWALSLCDTSKPVGLAKPEPYDSKYCFVANVFGLRDQQEWQKSIGGFYAALSTVFQAAHRLGATVAIPGEIYGTKIEAIQESILALSESSGVRVEVYQS